MPPPLNRAGLTKSGGDMSDGTKRVLFGALALTCLLWLKSNWEEYQMLAGNFKAVLEPEVLTISFGLLTFNPSPGSSSE